MPVDVQEHDAFSSVQPSEHFGGSLTLTDSTQRCAQGTDRPAEKIGGCVKPRVIGILLTYRRHRLLPETLRVISCQTRPLDRLLVVDNENSDTTRKIVEQHRTAFPGTEILYVATPNNLGSAGGWTFGMRQLVDDAVDEDWIMPLDDDNPPQDDHEIERILDFANRASDQFQDVGVVGITGARLARRSGRIIRLTDDQLHGCVPVDWVGTGGLPLYRVFVLRKAGMFDEQLFFGHTEMEFGLRLRQAGYRILAHGEMWRERRQKAGHLGITRCPSRLCAINWKRYYSIRNFIHIMKCHGRWDVVIKQVIIQCLAKPLCTVLVAPSNAVAGFRLALRASFDGIFGRMGRRVEPEE